MARQDAAPPEVAQDLLNKHRVTSGGAASSRAGGCEIMENIGVFSCFPLFWSPAGGTPAPRLRIRFSPAFHVRGAVFMVFNVGIPPAQGRKRTNSDLSDASANAPAMRSGSFFFRHPMRARTDAPDAGPPSLRARGRFFRFGMAAQRAGMGKMPIARAATDAPGHGVSVAARMVGEALGWPMGCFAGALAEASEKSEFFFGFPAGGSPAPPGGPRR